MLVFQRLFMAAFIVALTTLNLFAEGEPKMPMLNWMGREKATKSVKDVVMKILREDKSLSYGTDDNLLVHGDNLEALKALLPFYAGQVKCIYIDPPYNTGSAFEHYDDNLEHSTWLNMMYPRLKLLREFLREDGSIWISIDDKECHYLKVICDEIFGRQNFVIQTTIKRGAATGHKAINPTPVQVSDYMLTYAKDKSKWKYHPVYAKRGYDKAYNKYIINYDDPFEKWEFCSLKDMLKKRKCTVEEFLKTEAHRVVRTAQPNYNAVGEETRRLIDDSRCDPSRIYLQKREGHSDIYLKNGERILFYKDKLRCIDGEWVTAELVTSIWNDMNYQGIAKEGAVTFLKSKKPEAQIARILEMSTIPGDLVLDSFLGSGTTTAVAHKMGRRWIGIEMGDHAKTHCAVRMKKVVDGEQSGISKSVKWQGGGGFRYYELGEAILKEDGSLTGDIPFEVMAAHVWFSETKTPYAGDKKSTVLGVHEGTAYVLLYNGILKDRSVNGGNVLTRKTLEVIQADLAAHEDARPPEYEKIVVYGEACRLMASTLQALKIEFRQTPYDLVTRR